MVMHLALAPVGPSVHPAQGIGAQPRAPRAAAATAATAGSPMVGILRALRISALAVLNMLNYMWLSYYPNRARAVTDDEADCEEEAGVAIVPGTAAAGAAAGAGACTREPAPAPQIELPVPTSPVCVKVPPLPEPKVKGGKGTFFAELSRVTADDFVMLDGLLFALPYVYDRRYRYHAAWAGRGLFDVFTSEADFQALGDRAFWEREVAAGRVVTREGRVEASFVWHEGASLWHKQHIHEPPVNCGPLCTPAPVPMMTPAPSALPPALQSLGIELIHVSERHVVVSKPPSLPIHPCGIWKRCSLIYLVAVRYGFNPLHVVHRLDKPVSGVVIFARSREAAADLHKRSRSRALRKTYVAEVVGDFAYDEAVCTMPLGFECGRAAIDHAKGKEARTNFKKLRYLPRTKTSLVEVRPITGRRHQIRAHLQWLGHPVVSDPLYGNGASPTYPDKSNNLHHLDVPRGPKILEVGRELRCRHCPYLFTTDVRVHRHPIHLHAWKYEDDTFSYTSKLPRWAQAQV